MSGADRILILGGTGEGIALASALTSLPGRRVISSLAGRVANPKLPPGEVRIGGFGGVEGLAAYLRENKIRAVIDATHPFARRMGWNAAAASQTTNTPLLRFERPAWMPQPGDHWIDVADWDEAVNVLRGKARRVFLALGRQELAPFTALKDIAFVIRAVDAPDADLAFADAEIVLARGPFKLADERVLLQSRGIDHLVCKNSGGDATDAKLQAARELGVTVIMQRRPPRPDVPKVSDVQAAVDWVRSL
ncbi:cobalt-precorrin-6A reductase [Dongia rigui]|uniref:Cobalt-precorrin-6A reductase n=1 Tax=Dongia rigui TaxID=940149 RepID=A0ABU5DZV3_9PROT|nr:cobalt-precorrin-6A reductase [Dongia rigui]MDY0872843.1 cobalt-precorrin-6A reductase [Dongia rigui]